MCSIHRAIKIAPLTPLHIIRDYKIKLSVTVVIHPSRTRGKFIRPPQSSRLRHIGERAVSVVVEQMALSQRGDEQIVEAVVIVIPHRNPKPKHRHSQPSLPRNIGKSSIAIIVIKLRRRSPAVRMPRKVVAVHQEDVGIPIIVVIDECTTRPHRLRQPLLPESPIVVREMDASLCGDIAKMNLLRNCHARKGESRQPQRHRGAEKS